MGGWGVGQFLLGKKFFSALEFPRMFFRNCPTPYPDRKIKWPVQSPRRNVAIKFSIYSFEGKL